MPCPLASPCAPGIAAGQAAHLQAFQAVGGASRFEGHVRQRAALVHRVGLDQAFDRLGADQLEHALDRHRLGLVIAVEGAQLGRHLGGEPQVADEQGEIAHA